jgi:hypothetical protein
MADLFADFTRRVRVAAVEDDRGRARVRERRRDGAADVAVGAGDYCDAVLDSEELVFV